MHGANVEISVFCPKCQKILSTHHVYAEFTRLKKLNEEELTKHYINSPECKQ